MPTRNEYLHALECLKDLMKFVNENEDARFGTSFRMLDMNKEIMMETDLGYWEEGNESLLKYLERKAENGER